MKRWRRPKLKPGFLTMYYGRDDDGNVDVCISNGKGCPRGDSHLLHMVLCSGRLNWKKEWEPSLVKELEDRGYDITTLKFSIQKKPQQG